MCNARMAQRLASSMKPPLITWPHAGIPPEVARKLQVQAFIGDAFVELEDAKAARPDARTGTKSSGGRHAVNAPATLKPAIGCAR